MEYTDLGYAIREPGGEPILFLTGTIVKNKHGVQTSQETHMRPPHEGWRCAHVLVDKNSGELVVWCAQLTFRFRAITEKEEKKPDIVEIECRTKKDGEPLMLDAKSRNLILCIESQVEGNLRKYPPIEHKNKRKQ